MTFNDAWKSCVSRGADLASITSLDQQLFVTDVVGPEGRILSVKILLAYSFFDRFDRQLCLSE